MELSDPLSAYHAGKASSAKELVALVEREGVVPDRVWRRGGPPVVVAGESLFLVSDGEAYRVRRAEVTGIGQVRSSDYRMMQLGTLLYLLALPIALLGGGGAIWVGLGVVVLGGVLVTKGFLSRALLVQVEDDRIPPFVIDHRKWKEIRSSIGSWPEA